MDGVKNKTDRQLLYVFSYICILDFKFFGVYATIQIITEYQARDQDGWKKIISQGRKRKGNVVF